MDDTRDLWFYRPKPQQAPRLRLFCFPHSGATSAVFRLWPNELPADVEIVGIQLPGRTWRQHEPALQSVSDAAPALAAALQSLLDAPFALFGHSLGGLLAFEVARELRRCAAPEPDALLVSGRRPPNYRSTDELHKLPEDRLLLSLVRLGGLPASALHDADMRSLILPALRADLTMSETYNYVPEPPLSVPLTVFAGDDDPLVPLASIEDWRAQTSGAFRCHVFVGGHFFIQSSAQQFFRELANAIR